jgi:hypothetical protein
MPLEVGLLRVCTLQMPSEMVIFWVREMGEIVRNEKGHTKPSYPICHDELLS